MSDISPLSTLLERWWLGVVIVGLIVLSGFFSGAETALTSVSARIRELARQGDWRAVIVEKLRERKDLLLGTILIGNNLVNILAAALATSLALHFFGAQGVLWATLIMTVATVVFAEVLPKSWALMRADKTALWVAPILRPLVFVLQPITRPLRALLRLLKATPQGGDGGRGDGRGRDGRGGDGRGGDGVLASARERIETMRGAIDLHTPRLHEGHKMLHSVLDLDEASLEDIMTHRKEVAMVDIGWDFDTVARFVVESPWTRFPVFDKREDNIVGVLHAKAFFRQWYNRGQSSSPQQDDDAAVSLHDCLSAPWFVPESTKLRDQLRAFQKRREHVAIVVDEYGAFMGIVALEDVIEQIVGNIDDEHDASTSQEICSLDDGSYIVAGDVPLRTLRREMNWQLPEDKAVTLAGFVIQEARDLTEQGQQFVFHGFRFKILRKEENRIASVHVTKLDQEHIAKA